MTDTAAPLGIETMPEFETAKAQYDGAITAAKAASDEVAEARAEAEFARAQMGLMTRQQQAAAFEASLNSVRLETKNKYPRVPDVVYSHLTDAAKIEEVAAAAAAAIEEAAPARSQAPPPPSRQWPQPPAVTQQRAPGQHPLDDPQAFQETMQKARADHRNKKEQQSIVDYGLRQMQAARSGKYSKVNPDWVLSTTGFGEPE